MQEHIRSISYNADEKTEFGSINEEIGHISE